MTDEGAHHRLIERPGGISGIRPSFWCAVCGRKADSNKDARCIEDGCPNLCHVKCLCGAPEYICDNTAQLREQAGIRDPVTYTTRATAGGTGITDPLSNNLAVSSQAENLEDLTRDQLVALVSDLRNELVFRDEDTNAAFELLDEVPNLRSAAIKTISILDSLLALRDNLKSNKVKKEKQSIACTAKPEEIDSEWIVHITDNSEVQEWWDGTQRSEAEVEADNSLLSILALPPSHSPSFDLTPTPLHVEGTEGGESSLTASQLERCDEPDNRPPPPPHPHTSPSDPPDSPPLSHTHSSPNSQPTSAPVLPQPLPSASSNGLPAPTPPPTHHGSTPSCHHSPPQPVTGDALSARPASAHPSSRPLLVAANSTIQQEAEPTNSRPPAEGPTQRHQPSHNQGRRKKTRQTRDNTVSNTEVVRPRQDSRPRPDIRKRQDSRQRRNEGPTQGASARQDTRTGLGARPKQNTRPRQNTCHYCHRQGHTVDECLSRVTCEYCQGRFHTARTCRERQADIRHQNLIEAVKIGRQETLALLKGFPLYPQNTWAPSIPAAQAAPTQHFVPPQSVAFPTLYTPHHAFQSQQTTTRAV